MKKSNALHIEKHAHQGRRITLGIALVLLGVLTVLNLLGFSNSYRVVPVQGADMYQSK